MSDQKKLYSENVPSVFIVNRLSIRDNLINEELIEQIKKIQSLHYDVVVKFLHTRGKIPNLKTE